MGLAGTAWTLVEFDVADEGVIPAVTGGAATLEFSEESEQTGRVSGSGGCNRYFASYTHSGDRISIGPAGSTRMMCDAPRMAQEDRFFLALQSVESYELRDGELVVSYAGGTLRFAPAPRENADRGD
jgi:heat shock protein HslJ